LLSILTRGALTTSCWNKNGFHFYHLLKQHIRLYSQRLNSARTRLKLFLS
ncbi:hypothetical protein X975_18149, partial [Stegodyphus mimosarum]